VTTVLWKETAFPLCRATKKALEKECCLPGVFCDSGDTTKFYRLDALPDAQPTVSKHRMQATAMNGSAKFRKWGGLGG